MRGYKFYGRHYGKRKWERWPKIHDTIVDQERDNRGPYGHGTVTHVDRDNQKVMVRFRMPADSHSALWVLVYDDKVLWDAREEHVSVPHYIDLNERLNEAADCDELITYQYYSFDDLRWSSHVTGIGAWITKGSYL